MERRHLPNLITMSRLVLAVVYFWLMLDLVHGWSGLDAAARASKAVAAGWVFGVAAGTDFLDGYFARRFNAVSAFGRIMDPFVDKVLVLGALVVVVEPLCPGSGVKPWMVIAILARELFVTSLSGESVRIYPMPVWLDIERRLAQMPSTHPSRQKFLDRVNFFGQVTEFDPQGRVLIQPRLRESALMTGDVDVLGQQNFLEVWNHDRFLARLASQPFSEEDARALSEFGV